MRGKLAEFMYDHRVVALKTVQNETRLASQIPRCRLEVVRWLVWKEGGGHIVRL